MNRVMICVAIGLFVLLICVIVAMLAKPEFFKVRKGNDVSVDIDNLTINGSALLPMSISSSVQASASPVSGTLLGFDPQNPSPSVEYQSSNPLENYVQSAVGVQGLRNTKGILGQLGSKPPSGGIMDNDKVRSELFDPTKLFATSSFKAHPKGSIADQFAPSTVEIAAYLPSIDDIMQAKNQGPKFLRLPRAFRTGADLRPYILPPIDMSIKANRPRINEKYYQDMLASEKKYLGSFN